MPSRALTSTACAGCGFSVVEGSKFCPECGGAVVFNPSEPAEAQESTILEAAADFARGTGKSVEELGKSALKSDIGQKAVAGAALGAVIGAALPLLTVGAGAAIGAAMVVYKRITK